MSRAALPSRLPGSAVPAMPQHPFRSYGENMGRKILLIEDDRETASYLAKGLGQEGHSVE